MAVKADLDNISTEDLYKVAALAEGYEEVPRVLFSSNRRVAYLKSHDVAVRSDGLVCMRRPGRGFRPFRWIQGAQDPTGYRHVRLRKSKRQVLVHRLVAEAFVSNPEGKPTVDHINRIRDDNRVENLRWATVAEQRSNSASVLFRKAFSVRCCEDSAQYSREYCKEYYASHREERKAKRRVFLEAHHERVCAQRKAGYAKHLEERRAANRAWYAKHRDQVLQYQRRRRQQKSGSRL